MRIVVALAPSALSITHVNDAVGPNPYLLSVSTLHIAASAGNPSGRDAGETPSLTVRLANEERHLAAITGSPLRARVDVYDDDEELFFSGFIASIRFGRVIEWRLES